MDDHLADHEAQADSLCIDLLFLVDVGAEKLEHLVVVLLFYTLAIIFDGDAEAVGELGINNLFYLVLIVVADTLLVDVLNKDINLTILTGELQGI